MTSKSIIAILNTKYITFIRPLLQMDNNNNKYQVPVEKVKFFLSESSNYGYFPKGIFMRTLWIFENLWDETSLWLLLLYILILDGEDELNDRHKIEQVMFSNM